jgi:hypothetical protein
MPSEISSRVSYGGVVQGILWDVLQGVFQGALQVCSPGCPLRCPPGGKYFVLNQHFYIITTTIYNGYNTR